LAKIPTTAAGPLRSNVPFGDKIIEASYKLVLCIGISYGLLGGCFGGDGFFFGGAAFFLSGAFEVITFIFLLLTILLLLYLDLGLAFFGLAFLDEPVEAVPLWPPVWFAPIWSNILPILLYFNY
jgi:hypothetical protein